MDEVDRTRFLEENLARQLAWIVAAESKVPFVFTADTVMLGLLATLSPSAACYWSTGPAILASIAAALGLASLVCLSLASFPKTRGSKNSIIYFGGIAKRNATQYEEAVRNTSSESYLKDLSSQCHRNAEIASLKYKWIKRALVALYLAVGPWALTLYLLYSRAS